MCGVALVLGAFLLAGSAAPARAVPISVTYADAAGEGFNDPTLGGPRRAAFEAAAAVWASTLQGTVPVVIEANMDPLGGSPFGAVLGQAGPTNVFRDWVPPASPAPVANTFYAIALANQLAGLDLDPANPDISATFNSDVDNPLVLGNIGFYYGTDGLPPGSDIDFFTVVLHEFGHGLGFLDGFNTDGTYAAGFPLIYDTFLADGGGALLTGMAPALRSNTLISGDVFWTGPFGKTGNGNQPAAIYAPNPFEQGSSTAHLDETTFSPSPDGSAPDFANELMTPFSSGVTHKPGPVATGIFRDMGWVFSTTAPTLSIADAPAVNEGSAATPGNATFTVTLSAAATQTVTVNFGTANGTALAGSDYTTKSGTLTFAPGETSKTFTVNFIGDAVVEPNENFVVNLTQPTNATLTAAQATGTITNDDATVPTLAVADAIDVNEGSVAAPGSATFTVTLSAAATQAVTVNYGTANGTAIVGSDFINASGALSFAPGETTKTFVVNFIGDAVVEPNETFVVNLTQPTNATISDGQGQGRIVNDDVAGTPDLSINDVTVTEGNNGTTNATFTVTLSVTATQTVSVNYATADGTATAGSDYTTKNGTLTFAPGETSKTIVVSVIGDTVLEPNETFVVNLTQPTNANLADAQGQGTIVNDENVPQVSINNVTVTEGNATQGTPGATNATFTITLSAPSSQTVSVSAIPFNGSARSPADYLSGGGLITFSPGQTTQTFSVPIIGDVLDETDEVFYVVLSAPVNTAVVPGRGRGIGTIKDDDASPFISIEGVNIGEGNSGLRTAVFRLRLSAPSGQLVKIAYSTGDDTATGNDDYIAVTNKEIAFTTGQTVALARVIINGDVKNEADETYFVNLSNPVGALLIGKQARGVILNDDRTPALTVNDASVTEGSFGQKMMSFTVSLSEASGQTVTVNYASSDGTARASSDYLGVGGTLSFAPGETSKTIDVPVLGDTVAEANETLYFLLTNAVKATLGRARGTGTILNDDASG